MLDERRVPCERPEPNAVVQPARLRVPRRPQTDDGHVSGPGLSRELHPVQERIAVRAPDAGSPDASRPARTRPVLLASSSHMIVDAAMVPFRRLHQDVEVAAIRGRPPDALVALGGVSRRSPGVHVRLDRGLRPGLVGGAEPETRPAAPAAPPPVRSRSLS